VVSWAAPSSDERIAVVNPASEEVCAQVPAAKDADIDRAVAAARAAFDSGPWPGLPGTRSVLGSLTIDLAARAAEATGAIHGRTRTGSGL